MHLLATFSTKGYDAWKADFDAHAERRDQAGLNLLQLWRNVDDSTRVTGLFEVADRKRAEDWLTAERALSGTAVEAHFLRVA